jgi:hypothetical protein
MIHLLLKRGRFAIVKGPHCFEGFNKALMLPAVKMLPVAGVGPESVSPAEKSQ